MISLKSEITKKILNYFFINPDDGLYVNELSRKLNLDKRNLVRKLRELETTGLLKSTLRGNLKIYSIDREGKNELTLVLKEAIKTVSDFYSDYLSEMLEEKTFLELEKLFPSISKTPETTVFVSSLPSFLRTESLQSKIIEYYCKKRSSSLVYLISGSLSLESNFRMKNLILMVGSHNEIPLKNNFADAVISFDPPKTDILQSAIIEFNRVTKEDGLSIMGFPIIEKQSPLSLNSFIRKIEYDLADNEYIEKNFIKSLYEQYFYDIQIVELLNFTCFAGKKQKK